MTDFTGAQVMAVRKSLKLSREKFAAQVGLTPAKLHNIETEKRAMKPEERELLRPHMHEREPNGGLTLEQGTPLPVPITGSNGSVLLLDEDAETLWFDSAEFTLSDNPDVRTALEEERARAAHISDLVLHLSPESTEALAVLTGVAAELTVDEPDVIGVEGLYQDGLRRVTNSELQTFKHCRRKWWLSWYRGLTPKTHSQSGPLALGTRVHEALAAWYVPGWQGVNPQQALEDLLLRDETTLVAQLTEDDGEVAAQKLIDFKKDADLARAMIEGYVLWLADTGADQGYTVIAPEQTLTTTIRTPDDAPDLVLSGTVDVLVQRASDNVILFIDHKTTQSIGQLTRLLLWDEQMQQYRVLTEANRPVDAPMIDGALYNMLRKVKRTATANPPFYERVEVRHNPIQLDHFRERLIGESLQVMQVEKALEAGVNHQFAAYPSPSSRCLWGCEFATVCPMFDDDSRAEDFITEHFVQINPMKRYDDRQAANLIE